MSGAQRRGLRDEAAAAPALGGWRIHVHDDARVLDGISALVEAATAAHAPGGALADGAAAPGAHGPRGGAVGEEPRAPAPAAPGGAPPGPALDAVLGAMCRLAAAISAADVVSVYLREGYGPSGPRGAGAPVGPGDALVLRGNVGFPPEAVGRVQLGLFDGLTGVVAARRRPVTVAVAQDDARYKHVEGLGEEQFPAYLGVPLLRADEVIGVLVLQRRAPRAFEPVDVALALSLAAPFCLAIERRGAGLQRASAAGAALAAGRAVGAAAVLAPALGAAALSTEAVRELERDLVAADQRLGPARSPHVARAVQNLEAVAAVWREVAPGAPDVVRAASERAPYLPPPGSRDLEALLADRRRELAELAGFLAAPLPLCGRVLVVQRLGPLLALAAAARGAAAVVCGAADAGAAEVLQAAGVPAISAVAQLAGSLVGGELLEVDAAQGLVRVLVGA
jgi:hypothetical protein